MASKIGVYFDVQNIGGGLDVEALAEQVRSKWSDLTPVVKVLPMLSVAEDEVRADIEANGLDGVLFCGASPRDEAAPWQLPVQVEHVNLREQCVLAYKNPDGSAVSGAAPALLTQMATDYVNMGVVKLQKSNMPESAAIEGIKRILVIGGGWTGLTAAQEAAKTGYEVILVEKADKLGGAGHIGKTRARLHDLNLFASLHYRLAVFIGRAGFGAQLDHRVLGCLAAQNACQRFQHLALVGNAVARELCGSFSVRSLCRGVGRAVLLFVCHIGFLLSRCRRFAPRRIFDSTDQSRDFSAGFRKIKKARQRDFQDPMPG